MGRQTSRQKRKFLEQLKTGTTSLLLLLLATCLGGGSRSLFCSVLRRVNAGRPLVIKDPGPAEPSNGSAQIRRSGERSIFRSEALRHYRQSQDRIVFPRFTTPRALAYLWILAAFFIILGFALALGPLVPGR